MNDSESKTQLPSDEEIYTKLSGFAGVDIKPNLGITYASVEIAKWMRSIAKKIIAELNETIIRKDAEIENLKENSMCVNSFIGCCKENVELKEKLKAYEKIKTKEIKNEYR